MYGVRNKRENEFLSRLYLEVLAKNVIPVNSSKPTVAEGIFFDSTHHVLKTFL